MKAALLIGPPVVQIHGRQRDDYESFKLYRHVSNDLKPLVLAVLVLNWRYVSRNLRYLLEQHLTDVSAATSAIAT